MFDLMVAQVPRGGKPLSLAFTLSSEMLQAALPRGVELTHESEAVLRDVRAADAARAIYLNGLPHVGRSERRPCPSFPRIELLTR